MLADTCIGTLVDLIRAPYWISAGDALDAFVVWIGVRRP